MPKVEKAPFDVKLTPRCGLGDVGNGFTYAIMMSLPDVESDTKRPVLYTADGLPLYRRLGF